MDVCVAHTNINHTTSGVDISVIRKGTKTTKPSQNRIETTHSQSH